ncbi:CbtB domain-containing protein [Pseudomonas sp. Pseu.R1]|uniref:CbtB domain-containing protein n=1 Tax=Pseudomonas sp. Pseu.R1 TaxID=3379818 RepID=UPI003B94BB04
MSTVQTVSTTSSTTSATQTTRRVLSACFAVSMGAVLLYFAGFSSMPALHNTAHDTRHTIGFPCH